MNILSKNMSWPGASENRAMLHILCVTEFSGLILRFGAPKGT